MPVRKEILVNGEVYHVYNRGAGKQDICNDSLDTWRLLQSLVAFNSADPVEFYSDYPNKGYPASLDQLISLDPYVEILAYAINPNHFHIVVKQLRDNGISEYMRKVSGGYTTYINRKYDQHSGALFQGPFKARRIKNNEDLQYILAYVHGNDLVHGLNTSKDTRIRNSRQELTDPDIFRIAQHDFLHNQFRTIKQIEQYIVATAKNIQLHRNNSRLNLE